MASDTRSPRAASGRFLLRTDAAVHAQLRAAARRAGLSLNQYCVQRLAAPPPAVADPRVEAIRDWAAGAFGETVVGAAIYGSWPRGTATADSDVDLLVVIEPSEPLRRELYRRCDAAALTWDGHPVQVQLVHPPRPGGFGGGLWPEIALDGIVLFERDFTLSRQLVVVRRAIADGRIVRRTAHGQPYWTDADAA